jgi:hypothetical protein
MSFHSVRPLLLLAPLCLAACREAKVTAYRIPKETDPAGPSVAAAGGGSSGVNGPFAGAPAMAATPVPTAEGPGLDWTAPAHWVARPASAPRKATYAVPGEGGADGDLSITAFPNDVGGELANINRWRGQVQLPPLAEADLAGAVTRLEFNGLHMAYVDFGGGQGAASQRMLGAIVPFGGGTWFFKLTGSDALVAREKPVFEEFLKTLKPKATDAAPQATAAGAATPAMGGPSTTGPAMAATPVPTANGPGLKWTAPPHWVARPASATRKATYAIPGVGGADGDLSITAFPKDVGGELANINRWRGQVQLPPLAEAELAGAVTRLEYNGLHIAYVDFGAGQGAASQRILGAIVPFGGGTWFFKLSGPESLLAKEKPAFEEFLKTLQPADQP